MKKSGLFLFVAAMLSLAAGCTPAGRSGESEPADVPLADGRRCLLEMAYESVSLMPLDPHVRNRATAQEKVVQACLELGQPGLATRYADGIPNWRRATAYADIALHLARNGNAEQAVTSLAKAERLYDAAEGARAGRVFATGSEKELLESLSEWRIDRLAAHIAKAHCMLDGTDAAEPWISRVGGDEAPGIAAIRAAFCPPTDFNDVFDALTVLAESGQFEAVKAALLGYAELYSRFYDDPARRGRIESAVEQYRGGIPLFMQIEVLLDLAESAAEHGDIGRTCERIDEADALIESAGYIPRMLMPLKHRVVILRHRAGQQAEASDELRALTALYEEKRDSIIDIHRAAILCRLAEAAAATGDATLALRLYERAVEEGQVNPNSRPRADDLSEICRSMALNAVEPPDVLMKGIEQMKNNLGDPW
jgi:tetratricopeptide (TPR) repeat protein